MTEHLRKMTFLLGVNTCIILFNVGMFYFNVVKEQWWLVGLLGIFTVWFFWHTLDLGIYIWRKMRES